MLRLETFQTILVYSNRALAARQFKSSSAHFEMGILTRTIKPALGGNPALMSTLRVPRWRIIQRLHLEKLPRGKFDDSSFTPAGIFFQALHVDTEFFD